MIIDENNLLTSESNDFEIEQEIISYVFAKFIEVYHVDVKILRYSTAYKNKIILDVKQPFIKMHINNIMSSVANVINSKNYAIINISNSNAYVYFYDWDFINIIKTIVFR